MTTDQRERLRGCLATAMNVMRPEWDVAGCVAALRALPPNLPLPQLVIAAARYCEDPANETPAWLADLGNRAWDSDWYLPCKRHPTTRERSTTGECAACRSDRREASDSSPRFVRTLPSPAAREARKAMKAKEAQEAKTW